MKISKFNKGNIRISGLSEKQKVQFISPVGSKGSRGNLITTTTQQNPTDISGVLRLSKDYLEIKDLQKGDTIVTKIGKMYVVIASDGNDYIVEYTEVDLNAESTVKDTADEIGYDNEISNLAAENVQEAIDELEAKKVDKTSIVDNLTTDDATKVLSAKQGKVLNDKKVDKITQEQRDGLGFIVYADKIVYAVDYNLNEMPIKASTSKEENTIVMRDSYGNFQDLYDHNTMEGAHAYEFSKKVDKTQTIIGIDLQDNILLGEFRTALGNATQSVAGLLSAEDKTHLDALVALLETNDDNNVVDTIGEILDIFQNYPEGAELVTVLQGKVDKVEGKGLSTNDFTDEYKNKVDTLNTRVNDIEDSVDTNTQQIINNQNNITQLQTEKQDKLVAGDNITIDENNVISASGGSDFHRVRIFSDTNKLVTTQMVQEGESLKEEYKLKNGYLFDYGTRNEFDYNTIITEDLDLTYSVIPPRYVQTTSADFNAEGDYTGSESYIILPADKPDGYRILNINVKGVATNGDYLTSCKSMFFSNPSSSLELDYLDTSNVTNMSQMFDSSQATTLDLSSFDTSNVIDMSYMFDSSQATELDLSSFDTSNVILMNAMFRNSQATTLDLSSFYTSNVTNMNYMFYQSQATAGYARTQEDADRFNNSLITKKPETLTFVVKEDITQVSGRVDDLELAVSTKANDNEVVKLTGNQSISGTKNFTGVLHFNGEEVATKGNTYTKGEIDLMIGDIDDILDSILGV